MKDNSAALLLVGPGVLIVLLAALAMWALILAGLGRLNGLAAMGERAIGYFARGRFLSIVWGVAAVVLVAIVAAVLFSTKVLALLGIAVLLVGLVFAGLGAGVAAFCIGRVLSRALRRPATDPLALLWVGVFALILASILPFAGWLIVLLLVAGGIGAVLETSFRRH